jgi:hypothetical protein
MKCQVQISGRSWSLHHMSRQREFCNSTFSNRDLRLLKQAIKGIQLKLKIDNFKASNGSVSLQPVNQWTDKLVYTLINGQSIKMWMKQHVYITLIILDIIHCPVLNITFQRQDSVSIFRWNLLRWAQYKEIVSVSGHQQQHQRVYKPITTQTFNKHVALKNTIF